MSQSLSVEFLILSVSVGKYVDVCTHTKRHLIYIPKCQQRNLVSYIVQVDLLVQPVSFQ